MTKMQLRSAVSAARAGRRRAKFSSELKTAVIEYCGPLRSEGASWAKLASELGLHESQVQEWCQGRERESRGKLRPVRLVQEASAAPSSPRTLSLELPGGATVGGLCVADVAALLKALR
jgi:transposase-like protein